MGPGLSSTSAPINMRYHLAQGVHWKGYPITPFRSASQNEWMLWLVQHSHTVQVRAENSSFSDWKTSGTSALKYSLLLCLFTLHCFPLNNSLCIFSCIHKGKQKHPRIDCKLTRTVLVIYMVMQGCMSHFIISSFFVSSLQHYRAVNTSCVSR